MANLDQFYIIVPEATTNLCENPSFETNTTGWSANGGSIARSTTRSRFGRYSLQHTPSSTTTSSARYGTFSHTASATLTAQCWGYWESGVEYRMRFLTSGGSGYGNVTVWTGAGKWEWKEVTSTSSASSSQLEIGKSGGTGTASTNPYWIDGIHIEEKSYSTTYCDGDQKGCYWQFTEHGSKSTRFSNYRGAGKKTLLSTFDTRLTDLGGLGAPTIEVVVTPNGYTEGGSFQKSSVKERQFALSLHMSGLDLNDWSFNQEGLFDLVKPDLVYPEQPFVLGWAENGKDIEISCKYSGGLELNAEKLRDVSSISLNLIAADPFWYETAETAATLTNAVRGGIANTIYRYLPSGTVTNIVGSGDANGDVYCALFASDGYLYVGGNFTTLNGVSANRLIRYNPQTGAWTAVGTGYNGAVRCLAEAQGILFVGGSFTTANSVACNGVSMYNLSAGTFSTTCSIASVTGTPTVNGIALVPEFNAIVIVGQWTITATVHAAREVNWLSGTVNGTIGGVSLAHTTPANVVGNSVVNDGGIIYIAGTFTSLTSTYGNVTTNGIVSINTNTQTTSAVGGGGSIANTVVQRLCPDGLGGLYITFTGGTLGGISDKVYWNGSSYASVTQVSTVLGMIPSETPGEIYAASRIMSRSASATTMFEGIVRMNRTIAQPTFYRIADTTMTYTNPLAVGKDGSLYAHQITANERVWYTAPTTVSNDGKAHAFPVIKIIGPTASSTGYSDIAFIRNITTGHMITFDRRLIAGETITIDLSGDTPMAISNTRGQYPGFIRSGGDTEGFHLAPGTNILEVGIYDEDNPSSSVVYLLWRNRHWTFHGGHI